MISLKRPSQSVIRACLDSAGQSATTYEQIGLSEMSSDGFHADELRVKIGHGFQQFEKAKQAIDAWQPLRTGWTQAHPSESSPVIDAHVIVVAKHFGFWSLNACRVVRRFPVSPEDSRYGFAYGTLSDHAECGEELFIVELDAGDGALWYQIRAVSKPHAVLSRLGFPLARHLQRRFRTDSARAMKSAILAR